MARWRNDPVITTCSYYADVPSASALSFYSSACETGLPNAATERYYAKRDENEWRCINGCGAITHGWDKTKCEHCGKPRTFTKSEYYGGQDWSCAQCNAQVPQIHKSCPNCGWEPR